MTVIEGVDFANERPSGAKLKAAGKHFVVRYLSPNTDNNPGKLITLNEVENYRNAGLDIGFVWETTTTRATQGFNAGVADARAAQKVLLSRGAPSTTPIYFVAQDEGSITGPSVNQYFRGIATVIPRSRIGAYGGIAIIKYLFNQHLITWGWQTYAWSAGQWEPRAQLQQYHNGVTVAGVTVDLTRAMVAEWGQWKAPAPAPQPPVEDEMSDAQVQSILDAIEAVPAAVIAVPIGRTGGDGDETPDSLGQWIQTWIIKDILDAIPAIVEAAVKDVLAAMPAAGGGVTADQVKAMVESAKVSVPDPLAAAS